MLTGKYCAGIPAGSRAATREDFCGRQLVPYNQQAVQELLALAGSAGMTLAQLSLAWLLRTDVLSAAIVGASRAEQLDELAAASGKTLSADLLAEIQKVLERRRAAVLEDDARALREPAKI